MKAETEEASQTLENMQRRSGRHLAFKKKLEMEPCSKGSVFQGTTHIEYMFEQSKGVIVSEAKQFLASRFQDFSCTILKPCVVISNQKSWPRDRIDLGLYGEQELVTVAQHFQEVLSSNGFDLDLA